MVAVGFIDTVVESMISVNHRQSIAHLLSLLTQIYTCPDTLTISNADSFADVWASS
ncbi:hypothetical protein [Nostoc sp. DedSLP04]|uniref:hypothetical protein n=1 Tax=Nostoc sp. DedSLP04 TaxID=3075401 RepID=UPI002AD2E87D|nr:hypothetical protein [Nostoc sp. DedSLP04]MDZ8035647.1 hypothetical protein [Nostoc sp. DedSLP04]